LKSETVSLASQFLVTSSFHRILTSSFANRAARSAKLVSDSDFYPTRRSVAAFAKYLPTPRDAPPAGFWLAR
jgi:hypothetical protein